MSLGFRVGALALLLATAWSTHASAHGRPPRPTRVTFDPNDPDRIILTATFGVVVSSDGGASWRWICAAAYGVDPVQEDPHVLVSDDGGMVVATFDGIMRSSSDLCAHEPAMGDVSDVYVVDLHADPHLSTRMWGLVSSGVRSDRVVRSDDGGQSWSTVGPPIEGILTERIAIAPSDASRIYVSAAHPDPRAPRAFLLRSDDGGESFGQVEIPVVTGERQPHVVGVDPFDADRIFVRMARGEVDPRPERLLLSDDGGQTFTTVLELPTMRGFTMSADGRTVWASSALNRGIWMATEGRTEFEQVSTVNAICLAARGEELWVCADQRLDGFALGRSTDGGARIARVLGFEEASELVECPRCSSVGITCPAWIPDLRSDLQTYFGGVDAGLTGLPRDAGIPRECLPDAGPEPQPPPPPPPGGCACRVGSPAQGGLGRGPAGLAGLVALGAWLRRRRDSTR